MPIAYVLAIVANYVALSALGGIDYGQFQALLLNVFLALAGIVLCLPFGILLALGRRASFPAVRILCVGYIELVRGTPLIVLLLLGATMLASSCRPAPTGREA